MSILKKIIKKNDFLYAIVNLYRNRKNKEVLSLYRNPKDIIKIIPSNTCFGRSPKCCFDESSNCGLFWYLREVLEFLVYCDEMGFVPIVKWSKSIYFDSKHGDNPFEYYYHQPYIKQGINIEGRSEVSYSPGKFSVARSLLEGNNIYTPTEEYISVLAKKYQEMLVLTEAAQNRVDSFIQKKRIDRSCLGVHARGTDFRKQYSGHPVFLEPVDYFGPIDEAILKHGFERVFLATDDQLILEEFKKHYGSETLVFSDDVSRGSSTIGIHVEADQSNILSKYEEGMNALCDMIALASCGGFISGVSNLSIFSRIHNLGFNQPYLIDLVLNKGLHETGIMASKENLSSSKNRRK